MIFNPQQDGLRMYAGETSRLESPNFEFRVCLNRREGPQVVGGLARIAVVEKQPAFTCRP